MEGGREVRREGGREGWRGGGGGGGGVYMCMCMQGHGAAASSVYWSHPSLLPNPPSSVLLPPLISPLSLPLSPSILPCLMHRQIINQSIRRTGRGVECYVQYLQNHFVHVLESFRVSLGELTALPACLHHKVVGRGPVEHR